MAGAAFAEPLFAFFVAGATSAFMFRGWRKEFEAPGGQTCGKTLIRKVTPVLRGRRGTEVEIITLDAFKKDF